MEIDLTKMRKTFPYRLPGYYVALVSLFFCPASIFIIRTPFMNPCSPDRSSGDCSLGSPFMEKTYLIMMVALGVSGLGMCIFSIWKYFKSKKIIAESRIMFTEDSIIGPLWKFWKSEEGEIKFFEIKDFKIYQGRHGLFLELHSHNKTMIFQKIRLTSSDFIEIYNTLAEKTNRSSFEVTATEDIKYALESLKSQYGNERHFIIAFSYFVVCSSFAFFFDKYLQMQIDSTYISLAGTFIQLSALMYFLRLVLLTKRKMTLLKKVSFIAFIGILSFIGLIGLWGALSFLNQVGDNSEMKSQVSILTKNEGQSKDSLRIYGQCYEVADFEIKDLGFGGDAFCSKTYPSISERTKVEVKYREGNFSQRWAVQFNLLK